MSMVPRQRTVSCPACARMLRVKPGIHASDYATREGADHIVTSVRVDVEDHHCPALVRRRPKDKP